MKEHIEALPAPAGAAEQRASAVKLESLAEPSPTVESRMPKMLEELVPLVQLRIGKALEKLVLERDSRLGATRNQLAARGLAESGMWVAAFLDIHVGFLEQLCRQISDIWTDLISKKGQPLSDEVVAFVMQNIDAFLTNKPQQIVDSGRGSSSIMQGTWALGEAERRVSILRAGLRRDLEIRRREQELFPTDQTTVKRGDEGEQDDLLPLYRKRQFESDLPGLLSETTEQTPLSLLFLDLDHFKQVNDQYGHPVGDEVLLGVAGSVKDACAAKGRCYRWGGEELAVLLPNYTSAEAASLAERIRQGIAKLKFQNYPNRVTVSVGVACCPEGSATGEKLVEDADKAMYQAKQKGRDRVTTAASLVGVDSGRPIEPPALSPDEVNARIEAVRLWMKLVRGKANNFIINVEEMSDEHLVVEEVRLESDGYALREPAFPPSPGVWKVSPRGSLPIGLQCQTDPAATLVRMHENEGLFFDAELRVLLKVRVLGKIRDFEQRIPVRVNAAACEIISLQ